MLFTEFNFEDAKEVWMEEAEERGKEIGIEIGKKKAKVTIAIQLFDILDMETISIKTGLSIEELNELREKENGLK